MVHGRSSGYWSSEQEGELVWLLYKVLTHSHAEVVGQNIIYDSQYTWRHWHFVPRVVQDTMISQHSVFSDLPKALAFIASTYCDYYVYWKDEGKNILDEEDEGRNWFYNCEDCVYTDEAGLVQLNIIKSMGLEHVHEAQQKMFWPVLQAMQRGVKVDLKRRSELTVEVGDAIRSREEFLTNVLGHAINPRSPKQMHTLFYEDLKQPVVFTRPKKGEAARPTLNDDALQTIALREPLLKPIINAISDIRTLGIFLSSFLEADLDIDQRMRCAYNIGGSESGKSAPKTYRLSSSENAFGGGCNLQTIPSEKSKSIGKAAARGAIAGLGDPYQFPNIREIFIPDPGHTWFDLDLDRADLQIVVAECNDVMLKSAMRMGADIHLMNAFVLVGKEPPPLDELVETHPKYKDHRGPYKLAREFAKVFCHGTNYGGGARTMAANTGRTVQEIDRAQKIWFGAHPGIRRWHDRVKAQVLRHRFIENRFGYRWYIFDRVESIIPEAIAWIPQSTVSNIINKIWMAIYEQLPDVQILLQVHDSLCGQMETSKAPSLLPEILRCAKITVPYEDPLIIPVGIKTSEVSWGAVK
jgi:DNA polymerase-1